MVRWMVAAVALAGCPSPGDLGFEASNNYAFTGTIGIDTVELAAQTDFGIDWSAVTTDIRGRAFDGQADELSFVRFDLDKDSILEGLDKNTLLQEDAPVAFLYDVPDGASAASISDFEIIGNFVDVDIDLVANDTAQSNWLLTVSNTPLGRIEALMSLFVDLTDTGTGTEAALDDDSSSLTVDVDLTSLTPLSAPAGRDDYTWDWSGVTQDVNGNAFDALRGDEVLVARFDVDGAEAIEDIFLRLDSEAAELYRLQVFGVTSANLMEAADESGATFGGFTTDGVWVLGIGCTQCLNPAPLFMTIVDVN
ncbi:MAG: hypothetical protein KTR31_21910 [Myxococcales bacterium]|nr:hypothetical protein [Myxococcales bacterium]